MARIRTIKPEFFTSEDVVALSPLARLLFIATWCEADKEGRLLWKPVTFKLRYFPADNCDINALCDELVQRRVVVLYGDGLAYIPAFKKHQHINPRESESTLSAPEERAEKRTRGSRVGTRGARASDGESTVSDAQVGREGKGRNKHASASDACDVLPEVDPETLADWIAVRKAKRAGPITQTVADGLRREAAAAGMTPQDAVRKSIERGWQGFQAEWLKSAQAPADRFAGAV